MRLPESIHSALAANPGKNYCADCLAQAAGLTLAEQTESLARQLRTTHRKAAGLIAGKGSCDICGRTEHVVKLRR